MIRYLFARLYGYSLGRSFRNDPEQACRDAITGFMILTGVPLTCLLCFIVTLLNPELLKHKDWFPWIVIPGAVLMYLITRPLQSYAKVPEIAARFRSPMSRRMTMMIYVAVLLSTPLCAAVALRFFHPR
jgi:hypothetical protein